MRSPCDRALGEQRNYTGLIESVGLCIAWFCLKKLICLVGPRFLAIPGSVGD